MTKFAKKIVLLVITVVTFSTLAFPALAANEDFRFSIAVKDHGYVYNNNLPGNPKNDNDKFWYVRPKSSVSGVGTSTWLTGERLWFRARMNNNNHASDVIKLIRNATASGHINTNYDILHKQEYWASANAVAGQRFRLAASKPSEDPFVTALTIVGTWCP